jgi:carnitine O-acetyltransferase
VSTNEDLSPLTFGNDDALPRVPLPTLEHSCARFLEWCAPLLDSEQLDATRKAVAAFADPASPAHTLHAALAEYDADPGVYSWLDTFWPYRYLGRRDRIALNANFFFLFSDFADVGDTGQAQVDRAAHLLAASVDYKQHIDTQSVPPETRGRKPLTALSMEQLKYLFSSTRIPGEEIDTARTPYTDTWTGPSLERHVVVFHRGTAYRMDVIAPDGQPYGLAELRAGLAAVLAAGANAGRGDAVGHLTTGARAEWAANRRALLDLDPANAHALETIETALLCLSLEHEQPGADGDNQGGDDQSGDNQSGGDPVLGVCDQLLHGDSGNRWFDKGVTLIVFPDGAAGINAEHCKMDGTTVVSYIDALAAWSAPGGPRSDGVVPSGGLSVPAVEPVEFVLDDALRAEVTKAGEAFADYAAATATTTLRVDFTAERAKALKCSPDAFAQLAYQLAHHRAKGHLGATYESIATRHFRHGRTEAMRVVTPEIVAFVEAMTDRTVGADQRRIAFRAAADAHVARAKQCQAGDAPEQHLWELQLIQRRRGVELGVTEPFALYDSPGWTVLRDDYLSTSAVPSPTVRFWGFGSTSPRCIGVAYALMADRFDLYLSTPASVSEAMHVFAQRLRQTVAELEELMAEEPATTT